MSAENNPVSDGIKSRKTEGQQLAAPLRIYMQWPFYLTLLLIMMDVCIFVAAPSVFYIPCIFTVAYFIIAVTLYVIKKRVIVKNLVEFAAGYSQVQRKMLKELIIPYAVLDLNGMILWANNPFLEILNSDIRRNVTITHFMPDITPKMLPTDENDVTMHIEYEDTDFQVVMRRIANQNFLNPSSWDFEEGKGTENSLVVMYLYDETEINSLKKECEDKKLIIGLVYIDNYEEAMESVDEVRKSLFSAMVERKINTYMQTVDAVIKKIEKDKFIFICQNKYLATMCESKFDVLDAVRAVTVGDALPITISIGIGIDAESYVKGYETARAAIDLALGRGGDQVVIKQGEQITYYGGKSASVERQTRVKARVKAHALKEFIEAKQRVIIMGHSIPDADSFGAAVGLYRIAKTLGKSANIVLNELTRSVQILVDCFKDNKDYEHDMFLSGEEALKLMDDGTLLVVVDVNRPNYTEFPRLLEAVDSTVVLDHHRQTGEYIDKASLSYIEPYASSTCEMVAEIMQYIGDGLKLRTTEADAMYSGILIDTNNFITKTGVRTFEAAAYLRKNGADVTKIRKMFRTDINEYIMEAKAVSCAEIFLDYFAFASTPAENVESPTITAAQVANSLLAIDKIKASFVFTLYGGKVYISARSIDEVNVQIIMEKLGGGGHMNVAGAQLQGMSVKDAQDKVKELIIQMQKDKEI